MSYSETFELSGLIRKIDALYVDIWIKIFKCHTIFLTVALDTL